MVQELTYRWGNFQLTDEDSQGHFLALGTTGGGKSLILRLLMQDALASIGKGYGHRALVYDAKGDVLPILHAFCNCPIIPLNPFDARGYAWDIAKDVRSSSVAMEIAHTLVEEVADSSAFFRNSARHLAWGVMISYMLSGIDWTLGDLIRGMRSPETCERIVRRHPETAHLAKIYFHDSKLRGDVMATITASLMPLDLVSACSDLALAAGKKIALTDAIQSEQIIVLPVSEVAKSTVENLNRCVFKRWSDLILAQPDDTTERHWTFVDELSEAGRLNSIVSLLKKARSKGGRVAIACQSISGLQDAKLYRDAVTNDLLSCISNRFVGRLECAVTAEYLSRWLGDCEKEQVNTSVTTSSNNPKSTTWNHSKVIQRLVLPSEFTGIETCSRERGLSGLFKIRSENACWDNLPGEQLFEELLIPKAADVPDFIPRGSMELLSPWTEEEEMRFAPPLAAEHSHSPRPSRIPAVADFQL